MNAVQEMEYWGKTMEWVLINSGGLITAEVLQAIGVMGFLSYLAGFAALQSGLLDGNGALYTCSNILGASLVLVSMLGAFNLASFLISVSWIVIGLVGLLRMAYKHYVASRNQTRNHAQITQLRSDIHASIDAAQTLLDRDPIAANAADMPPAPFLRHHPQALAAE